MKLALRTPGAARSLAFPDYLNWCREVGFDAVDISNPDPVTVQAVRNAGLEIGTADLGPLGGLFGTDDEAVATAESACKTIDMAAAAGVNKLFTVLIPKDAAAGRSAAFARLKETLGPVVDHASKAGCRIAIEGWPGSAPYYPALAVTPETVRALFAAFPSDALGLNYDPSHLIRIGVDHMRFLREFGSRVVHCHGKDATLDDEALYLYGNLGPTFAKPQAFGEGWWRYTIPGEGMADWPGICAELNAIGYEGFISMELEDFRYHKTWEAESLGLTRALEYLSALA